MKDLYVVAQFLYCLIPVNASIHLALKQNFEFIPIRIYSNGHMKVYKIIFCE